MNEWQVLMAVEARYEEGPFPLAASRQQILKTMELLRDKVMALLGEG
jgi:hypothetical protein